MRWREPAPLVANAMLVSHATVNAVTVKISPFDQNLIGVLLGTARIAAERSAADLRVYTREFRSKSRRS